MCIMEDTYTDNMIGPCLQGDCDLVVIKDRSGTQDIEPWLYSIPKRSVVNRNALDFYRSCFSYKGMGLSQYFHILKLCILIKS